MAVKFEAPTEAAEKMVEVRLIRPYVPANSKPAHDDVFAKIPAGEVISLPREEARRAIKLGIAEITADLV